jgi:DNA repair protein RecO (recombination protein O)
LPLYRSTAIVLRRRQFEETDKLLVLYGREQGKFSAIAKGARRAQSRLVGATEPLVYARLQLATGRNLDIITEATPRHTFAGLRTSASKIEYALYLAELTEALVDERQASEELFDLLLSSLYLLENRSCEETVGRRFEMQALDLTGYSPELSRCVVCRAVRPPERPASYSPAHGGILCNRCSTGQQEILAGPSGVLEGMRCLLTLPAHEIDSFSLSAPDQRSLRRILRAHISYHLERDLKSVKAIERDEED